LAGNAPSNELYTADPGEESKYMQAVFAFKWQVAVFRDAVDTVNKLPDMVPTIELAMRLIKYMGLVLEKIGTDIAENYCIAKHWWTGRRGGRHPHVRYSGKVEHPDREEHKAEVESCGYCPRVHTGYLHWYPKATGCVVAKVEDRHVMELELFHRRPNELVVRINGKEEFVLLWDSSKRTSRNDRAGKELMICTTRYLDQVVELQ